MADVVERIDERFSQMRFRDDDGRGFELVIVRAPDSDFHISLRINIEDLLREHQINEEERKDKDLVGALLDSNNSIYTAGVRIRMPMIGGGSHEKLWNALAKVFNESPVQQIKGAF